MTGPYPNLTLYPSPNLFPNENATGQPSGIDESGYWGTLDTSRPYGLQWLAVSLLTGAIICELPSLSYSGAFRRTLGKYESQTVKLTVTDGIDPSWVTGTTPFATALIGIRGAPGLEQIQWGGVVLSRKRTAGSSDVELTLATPECYADRRYTGAYTTDPTGIGAKKDQNIVVSDLVAQFLTASNGLPVTVVTVGAAGQSILAIYNDYDDKTVYSNLTALMGVLNGPEWTAFWTWDRTANLITPTFYVGTRIGAAAPAGLVPAATFDSANLIEATVTEDYTTGKGATVVTATSSGQGLARPQASAVAASFGNRPKIEYRFQPATSIQDPLTLQAHANRGLGLLQNGTTTVTLKAAAMIGPQLGVDWNLGDDIGYVLDGAAFPGGFSGVGRCIGYEADESSTSPVLYAPVVM